MTRKTQSATTRRKFLKQAAGLSAVAAGAPTIVSASAVGRSGSIPPSDRIVMGCVGVGGMGMHDMRAFIKQDDVQMVAVCDVQDRSNFYHGGSVAGYEPAKEFVDKFYADRNKSGAKGTGAKQGCAVYTDFRELIARDDIDAVSVTTPDHWHALVSIAAANSGKDIYCEKPLANSIGEGRAICTAVKNNDRILQVGSHERSGDNARFVAELVRNGRIGKLHTIRVSLPCGEWHHKQVRRCKGFPPQLAVPEGFDFDRWLGPAAVADYTPQRCHFWWRFILAYGGGEMTDRGAHVIDLAQLAAGTDDTGPIKINAEGIATADSLYDSYFDFSFENEYAGGVRMLGDHSEPRGVRFEGSDGWIFVHVHGQKLEAEPGTILKEKISDSEINLGRSPGHHRNFLDSVKSRKPPVATAEIGHRTATICHLNNIAMRVGRSLTWDPVNEVIIDDQEASQLISPTMRKPWSI